jgi:hypothetical protein
MSAPNKNYFLENKTSPLLETQKRLLDYLFANYDKRLMPLVDENHPLAISGTMLGASLIEVVS